MRNDKMITIISEHETEKPSSIRKKRSHMEISIDILRVALEGVKKSHIVYKANLNFKIVNGFLDSLLGSGLLIGPTRDRIYQTTPKGIDFIECFEGLEKFLA
jgi:predicted transcriptional regulator